MARVESLCLGLEFRVLEVVFFFQEINTISPEV